MDEDGIRRAILHGGIDRDPHTYSPPWRSEFAEKEIAGVTEFLLGLQSDYSATIALLATTPSPPRLTTGREIFLTRCQSCHGPEGRGDGPLLVRRNIKLRSDLTISALPYQGILEVITQGGPATGRSSTMPPWGQELSDAELASIARYVQSLANDSQSSH